MTETTPAISMILTDLWTEDTFKVVGEISIAYAQLSHLLWLGPKRLKKMPIGEWTQVASQKTIVERCKEIKQTYKGIHGRPNSALSHLLGRVKKVAEQRNAIIHGRWGCKKVDGEVTSRHRYYKNADKGVHLTDFIALRDEIRQVRDALGRFDWGHKPRMATPREAA